MATTKSKDAIIYAFCAALSLSGQVAGVKFLALTPGFLGNCTEGVSGYTDILACTLTSNSSEQKPNEDLPFETFNITTLWRYENCTKVELKASDCPRIYSFLNSLTPAEINRLSKDITFEFQRILEFLSTNGYVSGNITTPLIEELVIRRRVIQENTELCRQNLMQQCLQWKQKDGNPAPNIPESCYVAVYRFPLQVGSGLVNLCIANRFEIHGEPVKSGNRKGLTCRKHSSIFGPTETCYVSGGLSLF